MCIVSGCSVDILVLNIVNIVGIVSIVSIVRKVSIVIAVSVLCKVRNKTIFHEKNLEYLEDNGDGIPDAIFKPNNEDGARNKGNIINKYFLKDSIVINEATFPKLTSPNYC